MTMKIQYSEPPSCTFLGIPAVYIPRYGGGYDVVVKCRNIPLEGHELSSLREKFLSSGDGETQFFVEDISFLDDVEPIPNAIIEEE